MADGDADGLPALSSQHAELVREQAAALDSGDRLAVQQIQSRKDAISERIATAQGLDPDGAAFDGLAGLHDGDSDDVPAPTRRASSEGAEAAGDANGAVLGYLAGHYESAAPAIAAMLPAGKEAATFQQIQRGFEALNLSDAMLDRIEDSGLLADREALREALDVLRYAGAE